MFQWPLVRPHFHGFWVPLGGMATDTGGLQPILHGRIGGELETVAWAWERPDGGRSFGFSGLHFHENWRLLPYRRLVVQGVLWSLKLPIPKDGLPVEVDEADRKLE